VKSLNAAESTVKSISKSTVKSISRVNCEIDQQDQLWNRSAKSAAKSIREINGDLTQIRERNPQFGRFLGCLL
jgi:hypothetical protein